MAKTLVGMEIGNDEIYIADNGKCYTVRMPENMVDTNGIVFPESLAGFLKNMKKEYNLSSKDVAIILPESATYFRTVTSPIVSEAQLELNLPYEFRDFVGSSSMDFNYDYVVESVENDENGAPKALHLLAAAANKNVIDEYYNILHRAGLRLRAALPHEMSIINLMKNCAKEDEEYCFIGVGLEITRVYVFKGAKLRVSKSIEVGCRDIDNKISSLLNIDKYLAASYRETNHENILNNAALTEVYERIALEVLKTINFYKYENQGSDLNKVYFFLDGCDNEVLNKTITDYLEFETGSIDDIVPAAYRDSKETAKCLLSIGIL